MRRVSQEGLAAEMRELEHAWTGVTVSDIERGMRTVTLEEAVSLAYLLNCGPLDLCDPTGVASRSTVPIDFGTGTVEAAGISDWLRGRMRIRTDGPYSITYEAVPGHDKEREEAQHLWRNVIRARPVDEVPPPEHPDVDHAAPRSKRKKDWDVDAIVDEEDQEQ